MDPLTRLPIPPVDAQLTALNHTINGWIATISMVLLLLALLYGWADLKRTRSPMFVFLLLAGAMDALVEPLVDIAGGCWHPVIGQRTLFDIMGHPMPYWVPLVYAAFYGILAAIIYQLCRDGLSRKSMWTLFAVCLICEPISEGGMLHWHSYYYYGNQPLWIEGLPPLWWIPANVSAISLTGIAAIFAERNTGSWTASLLMLVAAPLIDAAVTVFVGFPAMVAVNSTFSNGLTQLCGVASIAIGFGVMYLIVRLVAKDSPLRWPY